MSGTADGVTNLLDKYGWPGFVLIVLAFFFWKALWPLIIKHLEQTSEFLKQSREQNERLTKEFLNALERRDHNAAELTKQVEHIAHMLQEIKRNNK